MPWRHVTCHFPRDDTLKECAVSGAREFTTLHFLDTRRELHERYPWRMDSYQSLAAWKRAHEIATTMLKITDECYQPRARALFDQLRRAAISIEANIVEGYALRSPLLFRRHLRIALGSAAETECLIRIADELGYLPAATLHRLRQLLDGTIGTLVGFLRKPVPRQPPRAPRTAHRGP